MLVLITANPVPCCSVMYSLIKIWHFIHRGIFLIWRVIKFREIGRSYALVHAIFILKFTWVLSSLPGVHACRWCVVDKVLPFSLLHPWHIEMIIIIVEIMSHHEFWYPSSGIHNVILSGGIVAWVSGWKWSESIEYPYVVKVVPCLYPRLTYSCFFLYKYIFLHCRIRW